MTLSTILGATEHMVVARHGPDVSLQPLLLQGRLSMLGVLSSAYRNMRARRTVELYEGKSRGIAFLVQKIKINKKL